MAKVKGIRFQIRSYASDQRLLWRSDQQAYIWSNLGSFCTTQWGSVWQIYLCIRQDPHPSADSFHLPAFFQIASQSRAAVKIWWRKEGQLGQCGERQVAHLPGLLSCPCQSNIANWPNWSWKYEPKIENKYCQSFTTITSMIWYDQLIIEEWRYLAHAISILPRQLTKLKLEVGTQNLKQILSVIHNNLKYYLVWSVYHKAHCTRRWFYSTWTMCDFTEAGHCDHWQSQEGHPPFWTHLPSRKEYWHSQHWEKQQICPLHHWYHSSQLQSGLFWGVY